MHEGTPSHLSTEVRNLLHATHRPSWIGSGGPVAWLPRSPDLNPLDFVFWDNMRSLVIVTAVAAVEDLSTQILIASADITEDRNCLNASDIPSFVGCDYAAATSNNSPCHCIF
ncbi:uncharacterized protein TNCV_345841 [Trichonephila clavipes]|nr:uncharacterized protein TNCV_345841 [Trichonephila clavipes]